MAEDPKSIKLFKLVNGDEIVAEVLKSDDRFITIAWPIQVVHCQGDGYTFGVSQWMEHTDNQEIKLSVCSIMAESEPGKELQIARAKMIEFLGSNQPKSKLEIDEESFASMEPVNLIKHRKSGDDELVDSVVESIILESGEVYVNEEAIEDPKYLKF